MLIVTVGCDQSCERVNKCKERRRRRDGLMGDTSVRGAGVCGWSCVYGEWEGGQAW